MTSKVTPETKILIGADWEGERNMGKRILYGLRLTFDKKVSVVLRIPEAKEKAPLLFSFEDDFELFRVNYQKVETTIEKIRKVRVEAVFHIYKKVKSISIVDARTGKISHPGRCYSMTERISLGLPIAGGEHQIEVRRKGEQIVAKVAKRAI